MGNYVESELSRSASVARESDDRLGAVRQGGRAIAESTDSQSAVGGSVQSAGFDQLSSRQQSDEFDKYVQKVLQTNPTYSDLYLHPGRELRIGASLQGGRCVCARSACESIRVTGKR